MAIVNLIFACELRYRSDFFKVKIVKKKVAYAENAVLQCTLQHFMPHYTISPDMQKVCFVLSHFLLHFV